MYTAAHTDDPRARFGVDLQTTWWRRGIIASSTGLAIISHLGGRGRHKNHHEQHFRRDGSLGDKALCYIASQCGKDTAAFDTKAKAE
jgi:hypothetical protein